MENGDKKVSCFIDLKYLIEEELGDKKQIATKCIQMAVCTFTWTSRVFFQVVHDSY